MCRSDVEPTREIAARLNCGAFRRVVVDHHGILLLHVELSKDLRQVVRFAAKIDPIGGEILDGDLALNDVVPVAEDELLVVLADDCQEDAALLQDQQGLRQTHRPTFGDAQRSLRCDAAPQSVIQVHHHQLDHLPLADGAIHGEDFVHHRLEELHPLGRVMILHRGRRLEACRSCSWSPSLNVAPWVKDQTMSS
jgi:hypothetical protein